MIIVAIIMTFVASFVLTRAVRLLAFRVGFLDIPKKERKIHAQPMPLLGGVAVVGAFLIGLVIAWPLLTGGYLAPKHLLGLMVGSLILLCGGVWDDKKDLPPGVQILFPLVAAFTIVAVGIGINYISNPFGDVVRLDNITIELFRFHNIPYHLTLLADAFTVLWLLGMMYTTKFLDGLDGLASSVTIVGACIIGILSLSPRVGQPETAAVAFLGAAAFAGFLLWNWHPAKIFLGESGALFAGFLLGTLSIISGGKIASTLLIMGLPILDVVWVLLRRILWERRSPFHGDQLHIHFRLLRAGMSHRGVVLLLTALAASFGVSALVLQSRYKIFALAFLALVSVVIIIGSAMVSQKNPLDAKKK